MWHDWEVGVNGKECMNLLSLKMDGVQYCSVKLLWVLQIKDISRVTAHFISLTEQYWDGVRFVLNG
jgi:hypothetical protein